MPEIIPDVRYPIGKYLTVPYSEQQKLLWLNDIRFLPQDIEIALQNMDEFQLDTPYREGGWTVRQLVHHIADSHMNAYIRFKLAISENNPSINAYEEKVWANMGDVFTVPTNVSVTLLHALHIRWAAFIETITEEQFHRTVFHPEHKREMSLWFLLGLYAWHSRHHLAHIKTLKEQKGW